MSLSALAQAAAARLIDAGIAPDEARRDAALLARHVLGWDQARWLSDQRGMAPPGFGTSFNGLVERRTRREPLAYITGEREFYGRTFRVTPAVLIPRQETELLVEAALECLAATANRAPLVVDVGTGSGCIAATIAAEHRDAHVVATDVSQAALAVARDNARRLGVEPRIDFRNVAFVGALPGRADLIVSNPPYVSERERPDLQPEVRDHEPASALFAGLDGLDVVRALIPAALNALAPGGALIFEIGSGQASAVSRLVTGTPGLTLDRLRLDLQGIPRVVVARRG